MAKSRSFVATPPGVTIREQLNERKMSQREFAARMNLSEKHVSKLINGDVQLTPEMAVKLEIVLGAPASFWNNLETAYREKVIKIEAENVMETDEELAKQLPYDEMVKFGWVPEARNLKEQVVNLRKYFEVVNLSLLENNQVTKIVCRQLSVTDKSDFTFMAWTQEARIKARSIETSPINIKKLSLSIPKIKKMTAQEPDMIYPELQSALADFGIALVLLPHLEGSISQGASFMDADKIVVGLTTRGSDADRVWFSLFHELAHILFGHIGQANEISEEDERAADIWSNEMLFFNGQEKVL